MSPSSTPSESRYHPYHRPAHPGTPGSERRYGPLRALAMSFFSAGLYRDAAAHWRAFAFGYLALLLGIVWLATVAVLHHRFGRWVANDGPAIVAQIPPLSVKDGELSAEVEQPYFLEDETTGEVLVVIDTTGTVTTLEQAGARVLLTKTEAIVERNPREIRVYRFNTIGDFAVDQARIQSWLTWLANWLGFILFPFTLAGSYFYRVIQILIYALIGLFFARILQVQLSYPAAMSVAILSITPPVLLSTAVQLSQATIPFPWAFWFLIAMSYLFFGVYSNRSPDQPSPRRSNSVNASTSVDRTRSSISQYSST